MSHPTCAVCGHQADGADHVRVAVASVPPEEPAERYTAIRAVSTARRTGGASNHLFSFRKERG